MDGGAGLASRPRFARVPAGFAATACALHGPQPSRQGNTTRALAERLRSEPRRAAGLDLNGEPVRLGERDCDDYLVGYVDEAGLAWESLRERLVATAAGKLVDALTLQCSERQRGELIEAAISELPDELLEEAMREAALTLTLWELGGD